MDDVNTQQPREPNNKEPMDMESWFVDRLRQHVPEQGVLPMMVVVSELITKERRAADEAHAQTIATLRAEIAALSATVAALRKPDATDTASIHMH
jgi:hypothetical protein